MQVTVKIALSDGVEIEVKHSATMMDLTADGHVYGKKLISTLQSITIIKNGKIIVSGTHISTTYPDMPKNAVAVFRGYAANKKEIVQPISQVTHDRICAAKSKAKKSAEEGFSAAEKISDEDADGDYQINPAYAHMTHAEIKKAEINFDKINNEGSEGYNPYRDNLLISKNNKHQNNFK